MGYNQMDDMMLIGFTNPNNKIHTQAMEVIKIYSKVN